MAVAMRGPRATAKAIIASVCSVIGTGQKGICVFAARVMTATPATTTSPMPA